MVVYSPHFFLSLSLSLLISLLLLLPLTTAVFFFAPFYTREENRTTKSSSLFLFSQLSSTYFQPSKESYCFLLFHLLLLLPHFHQIQWARLLETTTKETVSLSAFVNKLVLFFLLRKPQPVYTQRESTRLSLPPF